MSKSELIKKLKKLSISQYADYLDESEILEGLTETSTNIPALNIALSGSYDGGIVGGHTAIAGESRHFKTSFALKIASDYLKVHEDAVLVLYDTEFGSPKSYFKEFDIDLSRVLHVPITNVEELKIDLSKMLDGIERNKEKVFIIIDSIGNLASLKEVEDALKGDNKQDLSRQRALKSLFRIITPQLKLKNIPLITINHVYDTLSMYSTQVMSSGKGAFLSADNVWFIGRRQVKDGTEVIGYDFVINSEKSRFVKEKSKIPINVTWDGGISKWSGLLDIALEGGFVIKPKNGWYRGRNPVLSMGREDVLLGDKNLRAKETNSDEFWNPILEQTNFKEYIEIKFKF